MFSRQRGAALLILALIIGFVTAALLFNRFSVRNLELEREAKTTAALAEAKAALLGFAVSFEATDAGRYAFLPCTEVRLYRNAQGDQEGTVSIPCGNRYFNSIGRLPWRSLKSAPLRDGEKECLWYAVSGSYKNSGSSAPEMLNADTPGQFEIVAQDGTLLAGNTPENRAVAVIFSPGGITGAQNRAPLQGTDSCPGNYNAANYLETLNGVNNAFVNSNPDRIDRFILANKTGTFNDKLVFITQQEVFKNFDKRQDFNDDIRNLTEEMARCIVSYGPRLPWAAKLMLTDYRSDGQYKGEQFRLRGRVPLTDHAGASILSGCLLEANFRLWQNWKDHFFYAIAPAYQLETGTGACTPSTCLTVNAKPIYYAGIVLFAGSRVGRQTRSAPPFGSDSKQKAENYLEGRNRINLDGSGLDFESGSSTATFNDVLYCISAGSPRTVAPC